MGIASGFGPLRYGVCSGRSHRHRRGHPTITELADCAGVKHLRGVRARPDKRRPGTVIALASFPDVSDCQRQPPARPLSPQPLRSGLSFGRLNWQPRHSVWPHHDGLSEGDFNIPLRSSTPAGETSGPLRFARVSLSISRNLTGSFLPNVLLGLGFSIYLPIRERSL